MVNSYIYSRPGFSCSCGFNKVLLTEFIGILSTSVPHRLNLKAFFFSCFCASLFHARGGGHTANWALLASLCKTLVIYPSRLKLCFATNVKVKDHAYPMINSSSFFFILFSLLFSLWCIIMHIHCQFLFYYRVFLFIYLLDNPQLYHLFFQEK